VAKRRRELEEAAEGLDKQVNHLRSKLRMLLGVGK